LDKEAKQQKKDNFKIKAANIFRARNDKIKLKEANLVGDHIRLYKTWISEQQRRGRVFRKKTENTSSYGMASSTKDHYVVNINILQILKMNRYMICRSLLPPRRSISSVPHRINPKVLKLKFNALYQLNKNIS
jgi:hypothetical protein